jgi:hypothetical protein
MGAHARGADRGIEGSRVRGAVVGGVWKKCEKLLKKKVVKIFSDGNFGGWSAS